MNTKYEGLFRTENLKSFKKMLNFLLLAQKTGRSGGGKGHPAAKQLTWNGLILKVNPNNKTLSTDELLPFDPGWNQYFPDRVTSSLSDVAAMFVPTDSAMKQYFLPGGSGAFLIDQFGKKANTLGNLMENIDSIPKNIVQAFVSMLMKPQFVATVPSKFDNVMDDSQDPLGITLNDLNRTKDGKYDVKIANNGVAYMTNKVFAPQPLCGCLGSCTAHR